MISLVTLVLLSGAPATGTPALTEQRALALELVEIVQPEPAYRSSLEQMTAQMIPQLEAQARARGSSLPPDFKDRFRSVLLEIAPYDEVMEWSSELYAQRFTVSEIKELIAFYKTPLGQKLSSKLPELMGEAGKRLATVIPERLPAAMKKHGLLTDRSPSAKPTPK